MIAFLVDVHGETNCLLKAIKADLAVPELVAGCRALGLVCKLVISPLWIALEDKKKTIFDMSSIYSELVHRMALWSTDATPVMDGSAQAFSDAIVDRLDPVLNKLLQPDDTDSVTCEILQVGISG